MEMKKASKRFLGDEEKKEMSKTQHVTKWDNPFFLRASYRSVQQKLKAMQTDDGKEESCDYCNKVVGVLLQNEWFHSIFLFHFHKSYGTVRGIKSSTRFFLCKMRQFMVSQLNFKCASLALFPDLFYAEIKTVRTSFRLLLNNVWIWCCVDQTKSLNRFAGNLKCCVLVRLCVLGSFFLFSLWKLMHTSTANYFNWNA